MKKRSMFYFVTDKNFVNIILHPGISFNIRKFWAAIGLIQLVFFNRELFVV